MKETAPQDMEKERRTVMLAVLTLLMYGLVSVLGHGPFAFFPVNEIAFFAVAVYFSFMHFPAAKTSYVLVLAFGLLNLVCNQLFLGFFLDNDAITAFYGSSIYPWVKIVAHALVLVEITRFYVLTGWRQAVFTYPVILAAVISGVLLNVLSFEVAGLVIFTGVLYYSHKKDETVAVKYSKSLFYLWFFWTFLKLTTLLTIYLYDLEFN